MPGEISISLAALLDTNEEKILRKQQRLADLGCSFSVEQIIWAERFGMGQRSVKMALESSSRDDFIPVPGGGFCSTEVSEQACVEFKPL